MNKIIYKIDLVATISALDVDEEIEIHQDDAAVAVVRSQVTRMNNGEKHYKVSAKGLKNSCRVFRIS